MARIAVAFCWWSLRNVDERHAAFELSEEEEEA